MLQLQEDDDFAVVEMGANHLGEIAYTTEMVKPDVATVLNASASHLEGFGSLFGVARAKSEIFKGLGTQGTAILNAESQFFEFWKGKVHHLNSQTFSVDGPSAYFAEDVTLGLDGCAEFVLRSPKGRIDVTLTLPGKHNVANALAAAALAMNVGATAEDVRDGLQNMKQVSGRLNIKHLGPTVKVLDDSYNANVASVSAAIDLLASFSGRRVLILGDMLELGEKARYYHEQVGNYAREKGIDNLFTLGVLSQSASDVFNGKGCHFDDKDALLEGLSNVLQGEMRDITILVKGSRSSHMERVVAGLEGSSLGKLSRGRERIAC